MGNFESSYEEYEDVPVNKPPLRNWEITENSTRYERLVAAPSDEDRILMWWMWGIVASVAVMPVLTVFVGILSSARARKSAFNQYLLFLVTPDITYTSICIVNCFLNIAEGEFYSEFMCYFQSWYVMFGISGSAYMNALLAREIYHMLSYGQNFRHYETPTTAKIARDSIAVLLFSAFVSSWGIYNGVWHVTWLPYKTVLMNGLGCFPQDFDLPTGLFYYLFAYPALLAAPMGYVFFLCFRIWYKKMLPKQGRRRMLATFFLRLVAIYVIM